MRLEVSGAGPERTATRRQVEERLTRALARFGRRVGLVRASVRQDPRDGSDWACRLIVNVVPSGAVAVEGYGPDLASALDRAATRVEQAVSLELARRRGLRDASGLRAAFSFME